MKYGIQELKELLRFAFALQKGIVGAYEDKKVTWTDMFKFTDTITAAPAAFNGIADVDNEIADLDEAEKAELRDYARIFYPDLNDSELQILIEDSILQVVGVYQVSVRWKARADRNRDAKLAA